MRVFLTGVTGYLGSRVAQALVADGHQLEVMVRGEADEAAAQRLGATPVRCALDEADRLAGLVRDVDAVAHLAASDDPAFLPVNRSACLAMLQALRPEAAFVMHGGTVVFGDTGTSVHDGTEPFQPPLPLVGRAELEATVLEVGRKRRLRSAIVHASLVYGGVVGAAIPTALAKAAVATGVAAYPGDGDPRWSAVHVADWAWLIAAAVCRAPVGGNAFPVGGLPVAIRDLAQVIADAAGLGSPVPIGRDEAFRIWGPLGPALFLNQVFSAARSASSLGWAPTIDEVDDEVAYLTRWLAAARRTQSGGAQPGG